MADQRELERERVRELERETALVEVKTSIGELAKWLAWADRSNDARAPARFSEGADRYWNESCQPAYKGHWIRLAASLLGVEHESWRQREERRRGSLATLERETGAVPSVFVLALGDADEAAEE